MAEGVPYVTLDDKIFETDRTTQITRAALVLTQFDHRYIS